MKILIADDHPLVREGIQNVLRCIDSDCRVEEAGNLDDALAIIERCADLDLVMLDLSMPGMCGMESLRDVRRRMPSTPLAVVSASEDIGDIRSAIDSGANGYIPKSSGNDVMRNAIQLILSGGLYLPPQWAQDAAADDAPLTPRQLEILRLMVTGRTNKEIARELSISDKTVKAHLSDIFRRLEASNRTQAVHRARARGLVEQV